MSNNPIDICAPNRHVAPSNRWVKQMVKKFSGLQNGQLTIVLPRGGQVHLGQAQSGGPRATLELKSYRPISKLLLNGEVAFAQSYIDGEWDSPDLTALFDFALANEKDVAADTAGHWVSRALHRVRHLLNRNSKSGSKRNIAYHYDLGNDFYAKWLDKSMTYSSALYETGAETLRQAQHTKYQAIAEMLDLQMKDEVLEIGCGWGGFSELAARDYGCFIHGLTLSREQLRYAQSRYQAAGIDQLASASYTDYRDSSGQYDKIVSIEMFEAVGEENWDTYFQTVQDRLKPGGTAVLQIITIEEDRFETYRKGTDFIQRYIFPGGFLPSPSALEDAVKRNGLTLQDTRFFGKSYARTCAAWQKQFQHTWSEIEPMGYDTAFKRMWEYYLSYCEAGFKAESVDVGLFKIVKPA
ncbi:cyclopropane-fatty-acyl-phospholipid synthase family protein [Magnetovibrio sp. PR-2]|uniref:cyclopropane-fatty-acyl-phospholipid synthase family protein n=1 Tax=Magnetovibrio sp. PR-2 TaxID=3120356 RepID=UPI002FCE1033